MPQDQPPARLSERLAERREELVHAVGVAHRDALRAAQARLLLTTPYLWTGIGCACFAVLFVIWKPGHPNPGERTGVWLVGALFTLAAVAFITAHNTIKIRERRQAPHGGDDHSAGR